MGDPNEPSNPSLDGTYVDLGEDLLEVGPGNPSSPVPSNSKTSEPLSLKNISDFLESAKILLREGFPEDAKKILHRILILDPKNLIAGQILADIHETELRQILGEQDIRKPFGRKTSFDPPSVDSVELLKKLDQDLGLGMSEPFLFFQDRGLLESFCSKLDADLNGLGAKPRDWVDLGIGFLEMDLYAVSEHLFEGAIHRASLEVLQSREVLLSATCLLALTLILSGRFFEAISRIQPLLRDSELKQEDKIELLYLMGRAYEMTQRIDLAQYYYSQVVLIDPNYRDVADRLRVV